MYANINMPLKNFTKNSFLQHLFCDLAYVSFFNIVYVS